MYIIFVHGMGTQVPGSSDQFRDRIVSAAAGRLTPNQWSEAYWAPVMQPDEDLLYQRIGRSHVIDRYLFSSWGDVVAYSKPPFSPNNYERIQKIFTDSVLACGQSANPAGQTPLIVIGHSLGSVIASDGLWDMAKAGIFPSNLQLRAFFTMGSPIAMFALRFGLSVFDQPVGSPKWVNFFHPPASPPAWFNFYYSADLIAFPLKELNGPGGAYDKAVNEDKLLSPKGLLRKVIACFAWPGIQSHEWYFDDPEVIGKIVNYI